MSSRDARAAAVESARQRWIERLIDLTRRNNLLYFRDLKTGTLDLGAAPAETLARFWAGDSVPMGKLLPDHDDIRLAASGREIRRRALVNREEKGLETLYVAAGMASWKPRDDGRPAAAPVLLVPVELEARGREGSIALRRAEEGDIQVNLVLLHALEAEHGIEIDAETILAALSSEAEAFDPAPAFEATTRAAARAPDFTVAPRVVLGNFSFQKMAMVEDLKAHGETLVSSDLIAALAGDVPARQKILAARKPVDPALLDRTSPDQEFLVLDADSTQQRVIAAAAASQDGVIQGPPGTGKSQTISNMIADLVSRGRRVLFVAEKRAALDVVLKRLENAGLGHLALDLHGAEITRRDVMRRLAESLSIVRESTPVDAAETHRRFTDRRDKLNEHVKRLHEPRSPWGRSLYAVSGRLLAGPPESAGLGRDTGRLRPGTPGPHESNTGHDSPAALPLATRWRGTSLERLGPDVVSRVKDLLVEARGFGGLFLRNDPSPWTGAALASGADVERALDLARNLSEREWPAFEAALADVRRSAGVEAPAATAVGQALALVSLSIEAARLFALYEPRVMELDLERIVTDLYPAGRSGLVRFLAGLFNPGYRRALAALKGVRKGGPAGASATQILREARELRDLRIAWRRDVSPSRPPAPPSNPQAAGLAHEAAVKTLDGLGSLLARDLRSLPLSSAAGLWKELLADPITPHRLPRLTEIERLLAEAGAGEMAREIRQVGPDPALWPELFEQAWAASVFDRLRSDDPLIAGFNGQTQDGLVEEFCRLDRERLRLAAGRVRRAHAERAVALMNEHPDQDALVRREAAKKARHLPLRSLLAQAPDVLTALRPCWMASPLTVSQLLDGRRYFDVVLFDEASQILPEDAIPSLMRAERAVVAGDRNQLPPTIFFMAGDEDEELSSQAPEEGFESLLDLMSSFLDPWSLDWHYRSRDESLIAFSNTHIYGDRLVTFPGPGGPPVLSHVLVENGARDDAAHGPPGGAPGTAPDGAPDPNSEESSSAEVRQVVELVLEHAAARPNESLGVIAMGIPHARRVEEAIETALRDRPDLQPFFDPAREDRFFVKNLERVQGDERDAILLTVGYGKDRSGKLPYRFGPLLMKGGERRLNVAITRARKRLTLVSSFSHLDMAPGRSQARGVELLRDYLAYAASGGHPGQALSERVSRGGVSARGGAVERPDSGAVERPDGGAVERPDSGAVARGADGGAVARGADGGAGSVVSSLPDAAFMPSLDDYQQNVLDSLTGRGLSLEPLWGASNHRIDFAARHPDDPARFTMAIECDGPAYASSPTARDRDRLRRQQLEALGWRYHRIWSLDWFMRREEEVERCVAVWREAARTAAAPAAKGTGSPSASGAGTTTTGGPSSRFRRPAIHKKDDIDDFSPREIASLLEWIESDGRLRTNEELIEEMIDELGFKRRGSRIESVLEEAIRRRRQGQGSVR